MEQFPQPEKGKKSRGRSMRRAALGAGLLLSSLSSAQAQDRAPEAADNPDHIETTDQVHAREADGSTERLSRTLFSVDLESHFPVNEATIDTKNAQEIKSEFVDFLSNITEENVDQFAHATYTIFGSSDPRPTSTWESNEALTQKRLESAHKVLLQTLHEYSFPSEQVRRTMLSSVRFAYDMPDGGVTHLEDLTDADPDALSAEKKEELYKQARQVTFSVRVPVTEIAPEQQEDTQKKQYEQVVMDLFPQYEHIALSIDNSPSMKDTRDTIAALFRERDEFADMDIDISAFSDEVISVSATRPDEALERIALDGSAAEKPLQATQTLLEELPDADTKTQSDAETTPSHAVFVMTDEALQDLSRSQVDALLKTHEQKDADVYYLLLNDKQGIVAPVPLADVITQFEEQYQKRYDELTEAIAEEEEDIASLQDRTIRSIRKDRLQTLKEELGTLHTTPFTVSTFTLPDGNVLAMPSE